MSRKWMPNKAPRQVLIALGAAAALLTTAGCSGGATGNGDGAAGGSFTVGVPTGFVSHFTPGQTGSSYLETAVWTPLTKVDPKSGEVTDAVAESLESKDQKTWDITLKDGWTFHDGTPVTAQSFADAWNAAAYGPNGWIGNSQFAIIDGYQDLNPAEGQPNTKEMSGVEVTGKLDLRVTLAQPTAQFPYIVAATTWAPMPKAAFDDLKQFDKQPIGNGPFQVTGEGLVAGSQGLTLQRYDDYAGEMAQASQVQVKFFQDSRTAYTSFRSGSVDVTLVDGADRADAESRFADGFVGVTFPAVVYMGFPLWDERFEDPRVREAMALAVDREAIADSLLRGGGEAATALAPDTIVGSEPDSCSSCSLDAERAQQLLAESGGWEGPLTLWTYQDPTNSTVLEAIANQFRTNLGIEDVTMQTQTAAQIYENLPAHKVDGPFLLYTGVAYPHLYAMAESLFSTASFLNVTGYDNSGVAKLLGSAASAGDEETMVESTQEAVGLALDDIPLTPIYFPKGGLVHSDNVSNVAPEGLGGVHLASVTVG